MRPWLPIAAMALAPVAVWVALGCVAARPDTPYLAEAPGADWIIDARPAWFFSQPRARYETVFHRTFDLDEVPPRAPLRLRAFRNARVVINGQVALAMRDRENRWKEPREADVAERLRTGENDIAIVVANHDGPPAVWCRLWAGTIEIATDDTWRASLAGGTPQAALLARAVKPRPDVTVPREQPWPSLQRRWPTLLVFALLALAGWLAYEFFVARPTAAPSTVETNRPNRQSDYAFAVAAMLWTLLFWNNTNWLPIEAGFDSLAHRRYVGYLQTHYALPPADFGYQTHQAPLYYMLAAALLEVLHVAVMTPAGLTVLRGLSLVLGLLHLGFIFLSLRLLFPDHPGRQVMGLLFAACVPVHLFIFQYTTNETLTATLSSASIYLALRILCKGRTRFRDFLGLGVCLGAALSSKLTAIVLPPVVLGVLAVWLIARDGFRPVALLRTVGVACLACAIVGGWHYARMWVQFGTPLVRQIDHFDMSEKWVQPGFRMASHFFPRGEPLCDPFMAGVHSVPDALYSTFWGDGRWGGSGELRVRPPWNYDLMAAGYLLALIPTTILAGGMLVALAALFRCRSPAWYLLFGVMLLMAAALLFENLRHPSLYICKAWYALPVMVALCATVAWGTNWGILGRPWLRGVLWVPMGTWALCAFASFWIWGDSGQTLTALAASHLLADRPHAAKVYVARALQLAPQDAEAWYWQAETFLRQGDAAGALDAYQRALRFNPNDAEALVGIAQVKSATGDPQGALELLEEATDRAPDEPTAHWLLSVARQDQGDIAGALDACRRSLRLIPGAAALHVLAAQLYQQLDRPAAVALHCRYALRLEPGNEDALELLRTLALDDIDPERAVRNNRLVIPSHRCVVHVLSDLAWLLSTEPDSDARDGDLALQLARRVEALSPDDPRGLRSLAAALAESKRFEEAVSVANLAAERAKEEDRARLHGRIGRELANYEAGKPYRSDALARY